MFFDRVKMKENEVIVQNLNKHLLKVSHELWTSLITTLHRRQRCNMKSYQVCFNPKNFFNLNRYIIAAVKPYL